MGYRCAGVVGFPEVAVCGMGFWDGCKSLRQQDFSILVARILVARILVATTAPQATALVSGLVSFVAMVRRVITFFVLLW